MSLQARGMLAALMGALVLAGCGAQNLGPSLAQGALTEGAEALKKAQAPAKRFRVATYNVENLFDAQSKAAAEPGAPQPPKPEAAKQALAATFQAMDADVVALVEVSDRATLRRFRDQYLKGMGYSEMALIEGNDRRGIDVALLSRFQITHMRSHRNLPVRVPGSDPQSLSRDVLEATIKPGKGYSFTMFVTHLKSHHGGDRADLKREAEATVVRDVLERFETQHPKANFILAGDFNDGPDRKPLKPLLDPKEGKFPLLDAFAALGPKALSYWKPPYAGRIDYLMLSQGILPELVPNSTRLLDTPTARAASDHLPGWVDIDPSGGDK